MGFTNIDTDGTIETKGDCLIKVEIRITYLLSIVITLSGGRAQFPFLIRVLTEGASSLSLLHHQQAS